MLRHTPRVHATACGVSDVLRSTHKDAASNLDLFSPALPAHDNSACGRMVELDVALPLRAVSQEVGLDLFGLGMFSSDSRPIAAHPSLIAPVLPLKHVCPGH